MPSLPQVLVPRQVLFSRRGIPRSSERGLHLNVGLDGN